MPQKLPGSYQRHEAPLEKSVGMKTGLLTQLFRLLEISPPMQPTPSRFPPLIAHVHVLNHLRMLSKLPENLQRHKAPLEKKVWEQKGAEDESARDNGPA